MALDVPLGGLPSYAVLYLNAWMHTALTLLM